MTISKIADMNLHFPCLKHDYIYTVIPYTKNHYRTAMATLAAFLEMSLAMSEPDSPAPTTSTRRPAYLSGPGYAVECTILPLKTSCPGKVGRDAWYCRVVDMVESRERKN